MPVGLDRTGVGELAHLDIGAAVAQHLDALGPGGGMAAAVDHQVGAEAADDVAHRRDARLRAPVLLDVDRGLGAEGAADPQARLLGRADHDDPARAHLLGGDDGEHADGARALDHHGVADAQGADRLGALEGPDRGGQRLGEGTQPQRHVVGQAVDLGAGQHVQIEILRLGPTAPQVRRLVEAQIAAVIDRFQALVGGLRIVHAVITLPAGHEGRDHDLAADLERPAHVVVAELRALLDDDARDLVAEREGPGQGRRPVALEDVQIGAADAAGADLEEGGIGGHLGPLDDLDLGPGARPVEGGDANLVHGCLASFALRCRCPELDLGRPSSPINLYIATQCISLDDAPLATLAPTPHPDEERRSGEQAVKWVTL